MWLCVVWSTYPLPPFLLTTQVSGKHHTTLSYDMRQILRVLLFPYLVCFNITFFQVHLCCQWWDFILFNIWMLLHCAYISHLFLPFIHWWTPKLIPFLVLWLMRQKTWECGHSFNILISLCLNLYQRRESLEHMVVIVSIYSLCPTRFSLSLTGFSNLTLDS